MGPVEEIDDPDDPRVADYLALTDVALRRRTEPEQGLFIAEGELVIRRARQAGHWLRSVLLSPRWLPVMAEALRDDPAPVYVASPGVLERVTGFHVHRGALASVERLPLPAAGDVLAASTRVAVLEDVNSHTNLGAIFRCAAGLGMDAVLLSPSCADPLYRRSVRVSMGEVFAIPYARLEPWPRALQHVRDAGFTLAALTPQPGAQPIGEAGLPALPRSALLLGTEGPGLSGRALAMADLRVRVPMARGVDSLNVAAAAAVAFYVAGQRA